MVFRKKTLRTLLKEGAAHEFQLRTGIDSSSLTDFNPERNDGLKNVGLRVLAHPGSSSSGALNVKNTATKKESILKRARRTMNRHRVLCLGVILCLMVVIFFLNLEDFRIYVLRFQGGSLPEVSQGELYLPFGQVANGYQTMSATRFLDSATKEYMVRGERGDSVEVGLVHLVPNNQIPGKFTFSVYELTDGGKKKLFETSGEFKKNSWELFHLSKKLEGRGDGTTEIQYVIKPSGISGFIASMIAGLNGRRYYNEFAFLVPIAIHERKPEEMNVILISFDALRADHLGCYGYTRPTSPHIDSLAQEGILFTQAISSSSWTLPAHFSLLTSLYPSANLDSNDRGWKTVCYSERTIADILQENGYYTVGVTELSATKGFGQGFDRYLDFFYHHDKIFEEATNWLRANHDRKFFMFLHHYICHTPYEDQFFFEQLKDPSFIEHRIALYDGDIRQADILFGRLMEELESLDLLSNSIIMIVSDHGQDLGDHITETNLIPPLLSAKPEVSGIVHGMSVYDEVTRVPMIFYIPGFQPKKTTIRNQVRLIDIMPTILDYLKIPHENNIQGTSLLPLLKTGERLNDPPAVSEVMLSGPIQTSVRMNGYKYVFATDMDRRVQNRLLPYISQYALFDLRNDPEEKHNIYAQNEDVAREYHAVLEDVWRESADINRELSEQYQSAGKEQAPLSKELVEALSALGYLQ